jgi:AI-2 transport protein TqsA
MKLVRIGVGIIVVFLLGVVMKMARSVLVPFFLAVLLSFALTPALDFLSRHKVPRVVAITVILILTFAAFYFIGLLVYSSGKSLVAELPSYGDVVKSFLNEVDRIFHSEKLNVDITAWLKGLNLEKLGPFILSSLGPFLSFVTGLLLVIVFMIFILAGRGRMEKKIIRAFSPDEAARISGLVLRVDKQIQRYLAFKSLVGLIIGTLVTVVLALFGLPFAVLFGVLAFLLNYIPNLGAVIATALPVIMALFFFGRLAPALWVLLVLMIVHLVMGDVVEPRLQGMGLGLSPLLVLFSLFFWAWLWGIPGMIVAVPILAIAKIIFSNLTSLQFLEALME